MNNGIDSLKNQLKQWEDDKHYNQHMNKIKKIQSRKEIKKLKRDLSLNINHEQNKFGQIQHFKQLRKAEQLKKVDQENQRIVKKLNQIGRRKSNFVNSKQVRAEKKYYTINMKSREFNRKTKESLIQQQNNSIVQRIVRMRSAVKVLSPNSSFDNLHSRQKSQQKGRNSSLILPKIPNQHSIHLN